MKTLPFPVMRALVPMLSLAPMASLFVAACASTSGDVDSDEMTAPTHKSAPFLGAEERAAVASHETPDDEEAVGEAQEALTQAGIQYHDGSVMLDKVGIYYIWYGQWDTASKDILRDLASNLGGSGWWNINTTYTNGDGVKLSNDAWFRGAHQYTSGSDYSKTLSDADIKNIVANTINQGKLAKKSDAIYVVLTSKDVNQVSSPSSAFCSDYCGWHTSASVGGTNIKYAWVGDASQKCPNTCMGQSVTPNGHPGADGMAQIILHELTEAATDPSGGGWYSANDDENADKCSWKFGPKLRMANGAYYNIRLGDRKFLVQRNWVNAGGGYCAMSYSSVDLCVSDPKKKEPGLCGCGKREPYDVDGFKDAQGSFCADWNGYDCTKAAQDYGYTAAQQAKILASCSASCGVCPAN